VTWEELFERAARYERDVDDISEAVDRLRSGEEPGGDSGR
jgi:hypothetical protein